MVKQIADARDETKKKYLSPKLSIINVDIVGANA